MVDFVCVSQSKPRGVGHERELWTSPQPRTYLLTRFLEPTDLLTKHACPRRPHSTWTEHTKEGVHQLVRAEENQKSAKATKCIVFLLVMIFIMICILIIKHS